MTKPMGKRETKKMIAESGVWTYTDRQGRKWDIVGTALYMNAEWQCACGDVERLKDIAKWGDDNTDE